VNNDVYQPFFIVVDVPGVGPCSVATSHQQYEVPVNVVHGRLYMRLQGIYFHPVPQELREGLARTNAMTPIGIVDDPRAGVNVLVEAVLPPACAVCGRLRNVQVCTRCRNINYCSVDCQRADHRQHRNVCRWLQEQQGTTR